MTKSTKTYRELFAEWKGRWNAFMRYAGAVEAFLVRALTPVYRWFRLSWPRFVRWGRKRSTVIGAAKLAAICATVGGTATALSAASASSVSTGLALTAAGAGSYVVIKGIPVKGYEITKHVPPRAIKPPVNMYKSSISSTRHKGPRD